MELVIACDVGKRFDASAVCVAERTRPEPPHTETSKWPTDWKVPCRQSVFLIRELGRMKVGTAYTQQAYQLARVAHDARCLDPDGSLSFLLDCTGVGEGVADLLQTYMPSSVKLTRCWFTSSERMERVKGELRIGKPWMISRLTSLLETGRVKLGENPVRQALVEELQAFEYTITASGNYTANASSGSHDDLITCLGLATLLEGSVAPRYKQAVYKPATDDWDALHGSTPWDRLHE